MLRFFTSLSSLTFLAHHGIRSHRHRMANSRICLLLIGTSNCLCMANAIPSNSLKPTRINIRTPGYRSKCKAYCHIGIPDQPFTSYKCFPPPLTYLRREMEFSLRASSVIISFTHLCYGIQAWPGNGYIKCARSPDLSTSLCSQHRRTAGSFNVKTSLIMEMWI